MEIIVALITFAGVCMTTGATLIINAKNVKKEDLVKEINNVQLDNCKNFLVHCLAKLEEGKELSIVEKERFWENFDKYTKLGGNSYVRTSTEKFKKEGRL